MAATHTPTPWFVMGSGDSRPYIAANDVTIAKTYRDDLRHNLTQEIGEANAAFIVRAVNAHDDLVAALREVSDWISNWDPNFVQDEEWSDTANRMRAALARAEAS